MNERQFGYRVKQILNRDLSLDTVALARLKSARELALERQRASTASTSLAWANNVSGNGGGPGTLLPRVLVSALVLALGLFAVSYWYKIQRVQETVDIDAAVLTGELPIDAYLDKGFDAWLKSSSD